MSPWQRRKTQISLFRNALLTGSSDSTSPPCLIELNGHDALTVDHRAGL